MFVYAIGTTPIKAAAAVRKVVRASVGRNDIETVEEFFPVDPRAPKRKRPRIALSRGAAERSSPDVLTALGELKLGG